VGAIIFYYRFNIVNVVVFIVVFIFKQQHNMMQSVVLRLVFNVIWAMT
jgi:hypothetical protein